MRNWHSARLFALVLLCLAGSLVLAACAQPVAPPPPAPPSAPAPVQAPPPVPTAPPAPEPAPVPPPGPPPTPSAPASPPPSPTPPPPVTLPPPPPVSVPPPSANTSGVQVAMSGFAFSPSVITIPVGGAVSWINQDSVPHTVVSATAGVFSSNPLGTGGSFTFTFTQAGTYQYRCGIHPLMSGTVIVGSGGNTSNITSPSPPSGDSDIYNY